MAGSREALIEKITEIANRAAQREGLEVWSLELLGSGQSRVLRIYIDKPEGVSHADCELISHKVGAILDEESIIPGDSYQLEVSSPGVERKLFRPEHFTRFAGKKARLSLREPVENQRRWDGVLSGYEDGCVVLETGVDKAIRVRMEQIEKANLKFEW
ncbi:ribosome maturation factor RimP [uncultured Paludibaculum sp.]|uniref:ribosome maturation factor RimP n=1 Tax=uncultured Paludibaculum sp. TaxID=1765020 RepID=UPI002AAB5F61|nr:ribosome maturation factor RimP [uncultured Paludibaculum sp.]